MAYRGITCPSFHPIIPLASFVPLCDLCFNPRAESPFGCAACNYAVCKWCFLGGGKLMSIVANAQQGLLEMRKELEALKERVDGDLYVWV